MRGEEMRLREQREGGDAGDKGSCISKERRENSRRSWRKITGEKRELLERGEKNNEWRR